MLRIDNNLYLHNNMEVSWSTFTYVRCEKGVHKEGKKYIFLYIPYNLKSEIFFH